MVHFTTQPILEATKSRKGGQQTIKANLLNRLEDFAYHVNTYEQYVSILILKNIKFK